MLEFSETIGTKPQKINDQWANMEKRVLEYASLLVQKGIKDVMAQYNLIDNPTAGERCFMVILTCALVLINTPDQTTACTIKLLCQLMN